MDPQNRLAAGRIGESDMTLAFDDDLDAQHRTTAGDRESGRPGLGVATLQPFDQPRAEKAVRELLLALGEDPDREGLADTPARVARALAEMTSGLRESPARHLSRVFAEGVEDLVVVRDIEFHSLCEHHFLPFVGKAHVAYLPTGGRVVGLSKIARTVDTFARRPQVQERLTAQIADAVEHHLGARAVAVQLESEHFCMKVRGVKKGEARMTTVAWRGDWKKYPSSRAEIAALLRSRGRDE
jgi:GTP cyclohydrolase I